MTMRKVIFKRIGLILALAGVVLNVEAQTTSDKSISTVLEYVKTHTYNYDKEQRRLYDPATASDAEKELVAKAIEVSKTFGPDYPVDSALFIQISGPNIFKPIYNKEFELNFAGQAYNNVYFYPADPENYGWGYISEASIWTNGDPKGVIYGSGIGISFIETSYDEQLKTDHKIVPLRKVPPKVPGKVRVE